jgi:ABC-type transport system involved in multi-copper enzyme maturation permease subunit
MPIPDLFLPIIALLRREQLTMLRDRRSYVMMGLFICALASLVSVYVIAAPDEEFAIDRIGVASRMLFYTCSIALFIAAALLVPSSAASTVISEIQQETFEMLTLTHVRPLQFVLAKFIGSSMYALLLVAAIAPIVALTFFGVGIDVELLLLTLFAVTAMTLQGASAGVLAGCLFRKTAPAVITAYFVGFVVSGAGAIALVIFLGISGIVWPNGAAHILMGACPAAHVVMRWVGVLPFADDTHLAVCGLVVIFQTLFLLAFAYLRLRVCWNAIEKWDKRSVFTRRLRLRSQQRLSKRPFRPIPDWVNPVFVAEARFGTGLLGLSGMRLAVWCMFFMGGSLLLLMFQLYSGRRAFFPSQDVLVTAVFPLFVAPLIMPAYVANALTREVEGQTAVCLYSTLLTPSRLIWGKLQGGIAISLCIAIPYILCAYALLVVCIPLMWDFWYFAILTSIVFPATMLVYLFASSAICVFSSVHAKSTTAAIAISYLVIFGFAFGWSVLAGLFVTLSEFYSVEGEYSSAHRELVDVLISSLSPVFSLTELIDIANTYAPEMNIFAYVAAHVMLLVLCIMLVRASVRRVPRWLRDTLER